MAQSHDPTVKLTNGLENTDRQTVLSKLKTYSKQYGIPTHILSSIVEVESSFQTHLVGDSGKSFGLLQLFTGGGQGDGYTGKYLSNVDNNLKIGLPHIKKAYDQGAQKGLQGYDLLEYVAGHSGHPSHNGTFTTNYKKHLKKAFDNGDELSGIAGTRTGGNLTYQKADPGQWLTGKVYNVDPELLGRISFMAKSYGEKINITSGYRSYEEQARLYALYKSGKGNLAAEPGKSNHEKSPAQAIDISNPKIQALSDDVFKGYGLHRPVFSPQRELWHVELYDGGGGGVSTGQVREFLKNGFDMMNFDELSQGSYSVFRSIDEISKINFDSLKDGGVTNAFGFPEFMASSSKAIMFRLVLVIIGLVVLFTFFRRLSA